MTSSSDGATEALPSDIADETLLNTFLASSENGFILSRVGASGAEPAWSCTVAGGSAHLVWPSLV
ncbi:hypothetical protein BV22DRAFT_1035882 [Leucogyrophana mollusca]|uniref:Uncharacterized protein n=1 Tax=Leucogyrophana mollusca TaxID=85980 RepID=A0ACB8BDD7_9AGAM|nr:hypothetical protein BV22DRAFT_1035882 [Leucogyrophana mollusca]